MLLNIYIYIYFSIFIHYTHSFSRLKKKNYSSLDSFTLLHSIFFSIFEKRTKLWIILCDEFISIVEILLDNAPRPSIPAESSWGRVVGKWWWRISRHVLGIELFLPNAFKPAALPELIIQGTEMAPLVHPLDSFPLSLTVFDPLPLEDRGSSLTRGRRYNYGRWVGFKYSCFHYGMGLLSSVQEEEEDQRRGWKEKRFPP